MHRTRIVIIGGGSKAWAPKIINDMLRSPSLADAEYVLHDISRPSATQIKRFLDQLGSTLKKSPLIRVESSLQKAVKNADYVIITIAVGGLDSMAHDLRISENYGIYHTVGDTSGPGGWSRLVRNAATFLNFAEVIEHSAPGAMILNYTNPMTTLTDLLSRNYSGQVVGLCHAMFSNFAFLTNLYNLKSEDELSLKYGGINHFCWLTEAKTKNLDLLADLRKRIQKKSLSQLAHSCNAPADTLVCELATELLRFTGYLPYMGDRHTCEFVASTITSKANLQAYRLKRTSISDRKAKLRKLNHQIDESIRTKKFPDRYLTRSREIAADIISAHYEGSSFTDIGNLTNRGQISNLPLGGVVETPMRVDRNGFSPLHIGALPESILPFVYPAAATAKLTVDAICQKDQSLLFLALRNDALCSHLNGKEVTALAKSLLVRNAPYLPKWLSSHI